MDKLEAAYGRIAALERVVGVLIATHPDAAALAAAWRFLEPQFREDVQQAAGVPDHPDYRKAAQEAMARFGRTIDLLAPTNS